MDSRFRLCCTLMALALPTCNLFLATLCLLCGKDICLKNFGLLSTKIAIATVSLTSPLMVLRVSVGVEGGLWVFFCIMTFANLPRSSFWTEHVPEYIIGLVTPFKRGRPANDTNKSQNDSPV